MRWGTFAAAILLTTTAALSAEPTSRRPAKPPTTRPATMPAAPIPLQPGPITSPTDFAWAMPKETWPTGGRWDEFDGPKAAKWLRDRTAGTEYRFTMPIRSVSRERIVNPQDRLETVAWSLHFGVESVNVTYGKVRLAGEVRTPRASRADLRGGVGFPGPVGNAGAMAVVGPDVEGDVILYVSEATAKASKDWTVGDLVTFKGQVRAVYLEHPEGAAPFVPTIVVLVDTCELVSVGKWTPPAPPKP